MAVLILAMLGWWLCPVWALALTFVCSALQDGHPEIVSGFECERLCHRIADVIPPFTCDIGRCFILLLFDCNELETMHMGRQRDNLSPSMRKAENKKSNDNPDVSVGYFYLCIF